MQLPFFDEIENYIFAETPVHPADVIFIPGNGYAEMAELAADLYRQGLADTLLPSGRYAKGTPGFSDALINKKECYPGPYHTEWEFLKDVLVKNGVPDSAVLREDEATYTWENALFSRKVLEREGRIPRTAILCTRAVHSRRCLEYYRLAFPDTEIYVCCASPAGVTRENWRESQAGIDAVMGELGRIVTQFSLWMKDPR